MSRLAIFILLCGLAACGAPSPLRDVGTDRPMRIVSLDVCADQYVLKLVDREQILELQQVVRRIPIAQAVVDHAVDLVRKTRVKDTADAPDYAKKWLSWGAGPRASQYLVLGAKARAALQGRTFASMDDVRAVAHPVLRHRILTTYTAEADGITSDRVVDKILEDTPPTEGALDTDPAVSPAFSKS